MTRFLGWIVVARTKGKTGPWRSVSTSFQDKSSAEQYAQMFMKANPQQDAYVSSKLKREE